MQTESGYFTDMHQTASASTYAYMLSKRTLQHSTDNQNLCGLWSISGGIRSPHPHISDHCTLLTGHWQFTTTGILLQCL